MTLDTADFTLKPCPFCGFDFYSDDALEPSDVARKIGPRQYHPWQVGCVEEAGGCGAHVLGQTLMAAVEAWNQRRPVNYRPVGWWHKSPSGDTDEDDVFITQDGKPDERCDNCIPIYVQDI